MKTADRYAENLETLVNTLRHDLGKPELPVLVGTYRQKSMPDDLKDMNPNDFRYESDKPRPGALKVMQAQTNVANTILNSAPVILRTAHISEECSRQCRGHVTGRPKICFYIP